MAHVYSGRLETQIGDYEPEFQEVGLLFLDYIKQTNDQEECQCLQKSKIIFQRIKKIIKGLLFYEFFIFIHCIAIDLIYFTLLFTPILVGTIMKLFILLYLYEQIKRQRKYIGMKSSFTRKIFLEILFRELIIRRNNRIKLFRIDQYIAGSLNIKLFIIEILRHYYPLIGYIIIATLLNGIYSLLFLLENEFEDNLSQSTLPINVVIPFVIILIIAVVGIVVLLISTVLQILKILQKILLRIPKFLRYLYKMYRERQQKSRILQKYRCVGSMENDKCSICFHQLESEFIKLPCQHNFHYTCLVTWFKLNNSCPICRGQIL